MVILAEHSSLASIVNLAMTDASTLSVRWLSLNFAVAIEEDSYRSTEDDLVHQSMRSPQRQQQQRMFIVLLLNQYVTYALVLIETCSFFYVLFSIENKKPSVVHQV
jgi:hypothetical protein